ncbi:MAG TPA: hypothetical protein VMS64_39255 [Candidatus Methylomirabilis sp.]|nr:hypothetical protein [Candidatus Methylomirabilis sp.]
MTIGLTARLHEASQGPRYRWWALAAVECGNFVVYMDGFIVTLALPAMARYFRVGIHDLHCRAPFSRTTPSRTAS